MKVWRKTVLGYGTTGVKAFQPTLRSGELGVLGKHQDQYEESRGVKERLGQGPGKAGHCITDTVSMMLLVDFRWGLVSVFEICLWARLGRMSAHALKGLRFDSQ